MSFRKVAVAAAGCGALTALSITANDGWPEVQYDLQKRFSPGSAKKRKRKLVVLGSGWGALSLLQRLDPDQVDVTVVSPRSFFFYTPLLAGCSTGTVASTSITESMRWHLSRFSGSQRGTAFLQAHAEVVDTDKKQVRAISVGPEGTTTTTTLDYDQLVIAVGASVNTFGIPGVNEYATMMKEVEDSLSVQRQILEKLEFANSLLSSNAPASEVDRALHWVVVGGGPTGVELTAELCDFVNGDVKDYFPSLFPRVKISLIEGSPKVLGTFSPHVR